MLQSPSAFWEVPSCPRDLLQGNRQGQGGDSLRPLAMERLGLTEAGTEETKQEAVGGARPWAPCRRGFPACPGGGERAHACGPPGLGPQNHVTASLVGGERAEHGRPLPLPASPPHGLQASVSSTARGLGDANSSLGGHDAANGPKKKTTKKSTHKKKCSVHCYGALHTMTLERPIFPPVIGN